MTGFPSLTLILLAISHNILFKQQQHYDAANVNREKQLLANYDYIIVGGGSAGCVLASRLSEDSKVNVLLIEAGGAQTMVSDMPGGIMLPYYELSWSYNIEPEKNSHLAFEGQIGGWEAGKALGGSSTINEMIYNRGNRRDYDNWNTTGWSFKDVLPYFLKAEANQDEKILKLNSSLHSHSGLLHVTTANDHDPVLNYLIKAGEKGGYKTIDLNGVSKNGQQIMQRTISENGTRDSAATAYLERTKAYQRKNLHILTNALATKILFDKKQGQKPIASQVQVLFNQTNHVFKANKEIILSTGTIRSPQLLKLSGVGPKDELKKFNISLVADVPAVGKNLQDHIHLYLSYFLNETDAKLINPPPALTPENIYDFYENHRGVLTSESVLYNYISSASNTDHEWLDVVLGTRAFYMSNNIEEVIYGYKNQYRNNWIQYFEPYLGKPYFSVGVILLRPTSRGTIELNSTSVKDQPKIKPNYLQKEDISVLLSATKTTLKLYSKEAVGLNYDLPYFKKPIPGCSACKDGKPLDQCDDYIICLIKSIGQTDWHYTSTNKMRSKNDKDDDWVVDEQLRVKGVDRLRVIDASVFPQIVSGNTNAPTIMIAEKGADLIKNSKVNATDFLSSNLI